MSNVLTSRRAARALALQILYAADGDSGADIGGAVAGWPTDFELELPAGLDDDAQTLARRLAQDAIEQGAAIDERIAGASRNWRLERMARVDRNILRLAVGELVNAPDTPVRVVINEAVELAKQFGSDNSSRFVNGVLGTVVTRYIEGSGDRGPVGGERSRTKTSSASSPTPPGAACRRLASHDRYPITRNR